MIRFLLSSSISVAVLGLGLYIARLEAANHDRAARLHVLSEAREWYERRISGLEARIERFEFEAVLEDNSHMHGGRVRGSE